VAVVISLIPFLLGQSGPNRGHQPFWLSAIYIGVLYMIELIKLWCHFRLLYD
jgi:hypothetical protein